MHEPLELTHACALFAIRGLSSAPGRITSPTSLEASFLNEYGDHADGRTSLSAMITNAIRDKAKKAPGRRGELHFIALAVDEPYAQNGHVLVNTFLGGLCAHDNRSLCRDVPRDGRSLLDDAAARNRGGLLEKMNFDHSRVSNGRRGLIFEESVRTNVDGVFAHYYTDELQFVPNPFSGGPIEKVIESLPAGFEPFAMNVPLVAR